MPKPMNLVGQTFGRLEVIGRSNYTNKKKDRFYLCKCSCGREVRANTNGLTRGAATMCVGCLRIKQVAAADNLNRERRSYTPPNIHNPDGACRYDGKDRCQSHGFYKRPCPHELLESE